MSDLITRLADFGSPTISNALEILGEDPDDGFTDGTLRMLTAEGAVFVGRALTATMVSAGPRPSPDVGVATEDYWRYLASRPGPNIVVVQDLDPTPLGSMYGEVQARLHRSLDVVGIVTNGAVRDLTELTRIGFPSIGSKPAVSHAHARFVEIDVPVIVGGVEVSPGDLVHADRHGVQSIPAHIDLAELVRVAAEIEAREAELFAAADRRAGIDGFLSTWADVHGRWPERNDGSPEGPPGIPPP